MATEIKICMSFILHRPDSWKTSNSPDASMLRKLVRDRSCRPVLRGILESLLHYLTQALQRWTTRHLEKPGSDTVVQRTDWPDQRIKASMKQTHLKTSCSIAQLLGEHKTTQEKTAEISSKNPAKCWLDPQKGGLPSSYGGIQRTEDLAPRRLTTFQLLQSKFIRSTPKTPSTHQREVGSLSSIRRGAGDFNHCQFSELNMQKKNQTRREQGLKKGGCVKEIVAKFATAEHKEKNMLKKQPIKPRLIGKGIVLSSLMERFETMATVCKGSNMKRVLSSGGVKTTNNVKQMVASHESRDQQAVDQTSHKQHQYKKIKSKSVGQRFNENKVKNQQEQGPEQAADVSTKINLDLEEKNYFKAEQKKPMRDEQSYQKAECPCSFKQIKPQTDDKDVEDWRSEVYGEIQTTAEETGDAAKLKYGHLHLLCLSCVTESLLPEPHTLLPQQEAQMKWHVGTIVTCSPVLSICVDCSPKLRSMEPSERTAEHATVATDRRCPLKPQTEGLSTYTSRTSMKNRAENDETLQRNLPKYLIPRLCRLDYSQGVLDQTDSFPLLTTHPQNVKPLVVIPTPNSDTSVTDFKTGMVTCPPNYMKKQTLQTITKEKQTEVQPQEKEAKEQTTIIITDTNMPQTFRLSEETASKAAFEDSETSAVTLPKIHPERESPARRPKYTTINYGDPSVKQIYKPKIIRFTDTFTF